MPVNRSSSILFLAAALCAGAQAGAAGQEPAKAGGTGLRISVHSPFDRSQAGFSASSWIPVAVFIENPRDNPSGDFSGIITVGFLHSPETQTLAVSVPRGSRKRFEFFVWPGAGQTRSQIIVDVGAPGSAAPGTGFRASLDLSRALYYELGSELNEMAFVSGRKVISRVVGSRDSPYLAGIFEKEERASFDPLFNNSLELDPGLDFYSDWKAYSAFRVILLNAVDVSGLNRLQITALRKWAVSGGILALWGGDDRSFFQTKLVKEFFDVRYAGMTAEDSPILDEDDESIGPETVHEFSVDGGPVGKQTRTKRIGFGSASLLCRKSAASQFLALGNLPRPDAELTSLSVSRPVFPPEAAYFAMSGDDDDYYAGRRGISPLNAFLKWFVEGITDLPPMGLLGLAFIAYIAVVGPANYVFLRKRGLHAMMVASVPAAALAFLGIIIVFGFVYKGSGAKASRMSVLRLRSDQGGGMKITMLALRTPGAGRHSFGFGGEAYPMFSGPNLLNPRRIDLSDGCVARDLRLKQWDIALFKSVEPDESGGGLHVEIDPVSLTATIENRTGRALGKGLINGIACMGEAPPVGPGGTVRADLQRMDKATEKDAWFLRHPDLSLMGAIFMPLISMSDFYDFEYTEESMFAGAGGIMYVAPVECGDPIPEFDGEPLALVNDSAYVVYTK